MIFDILKHDGLVWECLYIEVDFMINEKKVKLMTRMASYEQNQGKEDFKINAYYKKDYVSIKRLYTFFWVTIGYVCAVGLVFMADFEKWMDEMSMELLITVGGVLVVGYIALLVFYIIITNVVYGKRHQAARARVKKYNHDLTRLLKIYEREN